MPTFPVSSNVNTVTPLLNPAQNQQVGEFDGKPVQYVERSKIDNEVLKNIKDRNVQTFSTGTVNSMQRWQNDSSGENMKIQYVNSAFQFDYDGNVNAFTESTGEIGANETLNDKMATLYSEFDINDEEPSDVKCLAMCGFLTQLVHCFNQILIAALNS